MVSFNALILIAVIAIVSMISAASAGDFKCNLKSGGSPKKCDGNIKKCYIKKNMDTDEITAAGCVANETIEIEDGCVMEGENPKMKVCHCSKTECNTHDFANGAVSTTATFASIAIAVAITYIVL